jgi:mevalonate kinase
VHVGRLDVRLDAHPRADELLEVAERLGAAGAGAGGTGLVRAGSAEQTRDG